MSRLEFRVLGYLCIFTGAINDFVAESASRLFVRRLPVRISHPAGVRQTRVRKNPPARSSKGKASSRCHRGGADCPDNHCCNTLQVVIASPPVSVGLL